VAILDVSEKGSIKLLDQSACAPEETGVQIQVPAKTEDIHEFQIKAQNLFKWFSPLPKINVELDQQ